MAKITGSRVKGYWPKGHSDQTFYDAVRGKEGAKEVVIQAFMPMVHMWAHKYVFLCQRSLYDDLVQEGVIGILKAISTFDLSRNRDGKMVKPSTWIWWKVRAEVIGAARKMAKFPKNLPKPEEDGEFNLEDLLVADTNLSDYALIDVEKLLIAGCGSTDNRRARIVKDTFGLLGSSPHAQGEVARKHGISKQTANAQMNKFTKSIRMKHPELREMLY